MDLQTVKSVINVPIEIEADTFSHYGIEIKSVSFEIEKDNETINFYGEIRPLNGNKIKDDISIVFIFYQKGGNISKIEESHIYSESFFKIDTISGQSENPVAILPPVFRGQSEKRLRETV